MRRKDHTAHFQYFRMYPPQFDDLLRIVGPRITPKQCPWREPLTAALKLALTVHFLAEGCSMQELAYNYRIGRITVVKILREVPKAIWESLNETAVKCPSTEDEWKKIADDFWRIWNFPLCLGAIDGKHCNIECPDNVGSQYFLSLIHI